jgi:subtilisin family serine protease
MDIIATERRGDGVKCVVIDTGIDYNHDDLNANVKGGVSTTVLDNKPIQNTSTMPIF